MASWRETTCFLLLLVLLFLAEVTKESEARPIEEGYAKVLQSLGCRCCDGEGGSCRSSWDSLCTKLDCRPWKFL